MTFGLSLAPLVPFWPMVALGVLALIAIQHVLVLQQLTPWLRLDGYYIVSDLTGVPDILSRVRPALSIYIFSPPAVELTYF